MKCERKFLGVFFFLPGAWFFFNSRVCLFVCTLENTNSLSRLKEILSIYTERKKIHECSGRGEGKKDEDKERKE